MNIVWVAAVTGKTLRLDQQKNLVNEKFFRLFQMKIFCYYLQQQKRWPNKPEDQNSESHHFFLRTAYTILESCWLIYKGNWVAQQNFKQS